MGCAKPSGVRSRKCGVGLPGVHPGSPFINSVALVKFSALSVSQVPYVLNEDR